MSCWLLCVLLPLQVLVGWGFALNTSLAYMHDAHGRDCVHMARTCARARGAGKRSRRMHAAHYVYHECAWPACCNWPSDKDDAYRRDVDLHISMIDAILIRHQLEP